MICDEVKPNCLVRACCTEICWEVKNGMDSNYRMVKSAKEYAYGNMRKNEYCPVCHCNIFTYKYINHNSLALFINCVHCMTHYELFRYNNDWVMINVDNIPTKFNLHIVGKNKEMTLEEIFKYMK